MRTAVLRKGPLVLVARLDVAEDARERMRGLLGIPGLGSGRGLLIPRCGSVHTCFMRFPLDLLYLDRNGCVCRVLRNVKPYRLACGGWRASAVVELEAGWLPEGAVSTGDRLDGY